MLFSLLLAAICAGPIVANPLPRKHRRGDNGISGGTYAGASAYASNARLSYALSEITPPVLGGSAVSGSTWDLSIDDTSAGYKQTIVGFGGAVTDSTVETINSLKPNARAKLLDLLMTSDGANFALLRHTIGASDMSAEPAYNYDENAEAATPSLKNFRLGARGKAMASLLADMTALNSDTKILGSSWSPPAWMKLNQQFVPSTTNCNNLNDGYLTSCPATGPSVSSYFAQYFVEYIQAYANLGTTIDYITIQNEPMNSATGFPTMYMYADEQAMLINDYVGPALADAGLSTKIWGLDHNTQYKDFAKAVLNKAPDYVSTIAWHCYDSPDWKVLTELNNKYSGLTQFMTECYTPPAGEADGEWTFAPDFVMGPLQNWASGAMSWDIGANNRYGPHLTGSGPCTDCQGLVTIHPGGTYTLNRAYYMIAQFSKFMPPGAIVLDTTGSYTYDSGEGLQAIASVNPDGTRTVVMINSFNNALRLSLNTTSGQTWVGNVPRHSTTTWVLPAV